MSCGEEPKLDPRARRTRALLQEALRALLREKRFARISVAEIAERAGVNRNTFYAHYDDKYALLESILRADLRRQLHGRFQERPAFTRGNFAEVAAVVIRFWGEVAARCPRTDNTAPAALQEEIREMLEGWLPSEGQSGPFVPGARDTAVTVMSWSLFGTAQDWSRGKRERRPEDVAQELARMLVPSASSLPR